MTGEKARPWVVISDYPAWPSPYFAELQRHAPAGLGLEFASSVEAVLHRQRPPGVVNLHRLKRLYRRPDGARTVEAAEVMLARLRALREAGWPVVWTVHNLLPIDGGPPGEADERAARGVLELADAVVTHTRADAAGLAALTHAPITIAGWAGLTAGPASAAVPRAVGELARTMARAPFAVLVLGNLTAYKDLPAVVGDFAAATDSAELFVVGPVRQDGLADAVAAAAAPGAGRVRLHLERVEPAGVHALYRAADAALCPYRTDGPWEFFTRVLHPSSVGTALAFGTPVIAPDLPAIREMTRGHPHRLYPPLTGPGQALAAAERNPALRGLRPATDGTRRWQAIGAAYLHLAQKLRTRPPRPPVG